MNGAVRVHRDCQMELRATGLEDQNIAAAQIIRGFAKAEVFRQQAEAFDAQIAHPVRRKARHWPPAGFKRVANQANAIEAMGRIAPAPAIGRANKLRCALGELCCGAAHEALVG